MKKAITFIIGLCISVMLIAQPKEVTLVVSGEGPNKTEATNNALRSAIEQAFGTFVSANTTILNDEVVKDEIATISSGNIQSYKELSQFSNGNGQTKVSLSVTVSTGKLIKYAKSHGSTCEFAGASFVSTKRLYDFYQNNTEAAISSMLSELEIVSHSMYNYQINVSEPKIKGQFAEVEFTVQVRSNNNTKQFNDILKSTISALGMTYKEISPLAKQGYFFWGYDLNPSSIKISNHDYIFLYAPFDGNRYDEIMEAAISNFVISDNTGTTYPILLYYDSQKETMLTSGGKVLTTIPHYHRVEQGLDYGGVDDFMYNRYNIEFSGCIYTAPTPNEDKIIYQLGPLTAKIPIEHLDSVSSFSITPKIK